MNKSKNRKLVVSVLVIAILLYFFPFYRIAQLGAFLIIIAETRLQS